MAERPGRSDGPAGGPATEGARSAGREGGSGEPVTAELDEEALRTWGREIGRAATEPGEGPGVLVALAGPLGAGKTTLVRAACRGAGVEGEVRSPTFTLHNHHRPCGRRPIHHVDLYRLEGPESLDDLGWDELVSAEGVVFVEWPDRAGGRLPEARWEVRLAFADGGDRRRVEAASLGGAPPIPNPAADRSGAEGERPC